MEIVCGIYKYSGIGFSNRAHGGGSMITVPRKVLTIVTTLLGICLSLVSLILILDCGNTRRSDLLLNHLLRGGIRS